MKLNTVAFSSFSSVRKIYIKKKNPRAIPSLNSYFPFTLHTLVEKRGRDPSRFAPSVQYIPIEEEGKIPSLPGTIANLPKRFTRIHSSLLKFPRNDHSIVHGRPRIGAESSFTPTPDILYRRWKGAFIVAARRVYSIFSSRTNRVHPRFLSRLGSASSTPLPHARLIRNAHGSRRDSNFLNSNPRRRSTPVSG